MKPRFFSVILLSFLLSFSSFAQEIPHHISYTQIYDFVDELATDRIIDVSSVCKPYSRKYIASKLQEASLRDSLLSPRQRKDLLFYLNDFGLELDSLPHTILPRNILELRRNTFSLALLQPAFHYNDHRFKCKINPIIGMDLRFNRHGMHMKRWWGAEFQATIIDHISIWGSIRDESYNGNYISKSFLDGIHQQAYTAARLSLPSYLNNERAADYHYMSYGGDYSDLRAGINLYAWWGSIGIIKDNLNWGDSYSCSNIIAGRAPSFPMISLHITPCPWFQFDYIHGWLASDVIDSTRYILTDYVDTTTRKVYNPAPKFIAANMITFRPVKGLNLSIGNSIIYGDQPHAAYFLPIAFFKSMDQMFTDGNGNSQFFFNVSSRNIRHLHLYGSVFFDEIKMSRFRPSNPENNPCSYKIGAQVSNWPVSNLAFTFEFTRTNLWTYNHNMRQLEFSNASYSLGHYLGANSQEIFVALNYKPVRSLTLNLSYVNAVKYRNFLYQLGSNGIAQKPFSGRTWQNDEIRLHSVYEVVQNAYAVVDIGWNHAREFLSSSDPVPSEFRPSKGFLATYTPAFYWGSNFNFKCGFGFFF